MPHYFITTASDRLVVHDHEGVALRDEANLIRFLCRSIVEMMRSEARSTGSRDFSAIAVDERGRTVMTATASINVSSNELS